MLTSDFQKDLLYYNAQMQLKNETDENALLDAIQCLTQIQGYKDSGRLLFDARILYASTKRKNAIYHQALASMKMNTVDGHQAAIQFLTQIPGWRDSDVLKERCFERIKEIEEERLKEIRREKELKTKAILKKIVIITSIASVIIALALLCCYEITKSHYAIEIIGNKSLLIGETTTLSINKKIGNEVLKWESSDPSVATINNNGKVTGVKQGTVTITARGGKKYEGSTVITVTPREVSISNGFVVTPAGECIAPVTIHTSNSQSCYVYFKSNESKSKDFSVFVKAGTTFKFDAPLGKYSLYYACGGTWYGLDLKFGEDTFYYEAQTIVNLHNKGNSIVGIELTLYEVPNGNLSKREIDKTKFPG